MSSPTATDPAFASAIHLKTAPPNRRGGFYLGIRDARQQASDHLERDAADEIALADIDAATADEAIGGGEMEIEVRQHEVIEIIGALHLTFVGPERKGDLALG